MKKRLKIVLFGFGTLVLIIALFFIAFMLKVNSESKTMTPAATSKVVDNLYCIQDSFSNLYLVKENEQYIAFDAGNDLEETSEQLAKLEIDPDKITAVFLTHSDGDHVGALKLFKNAKVYIAEQEEQMIKGEKFRLMFFTNSIDAEEYTLLADQQVVTIGNTQIKGILTPGHTPGSMSFLVNDKYLFTGDLLSIKEGKIGFFNEFFDMDSEASHKSISRIIGLPNCEYILSAHYGFTDDYINAVKDWDK